MRGRKPTAPHLKLVKGTAKRSRTGGLSGATLPQSGMPKPPDFLTETALREWRRVAPLLHAAGLLTTLDRAVLAGYCVAYGRWQDAERALADTDLTIRTTAGNTTQHPLVGVANKAMRDAVRIGAELGIGPSNRSRLGVVMRPPRSAEDRYFD